MRLASLIVLLLSLLNCTPKPPDVPVCEDLVQRVTIDPSTKHTVLKPSPTCMKQIGEPSCGHCTTIVTGKESYYGDQQAHWFNGKPWSQVVFVKVPAIESYAPIQTYMINSCEKMNCESDLENFKVKLDSLNGVSSVIQTLGQ